MTDMFKINEYGEVIREGNVDNSVLYNETAEKEISLLVEAVFRHHEHYSEQALNEKKKQLDELWKKYGKVDNSVLKLEMAKRKLELKSSADKSLLNNALLNLKKNKDAGL